jgi:hypothetical protein
MSDADWAYFLSRVIVDKGPGTEPYRFEFNGPCDRGLYEVFARPTRAEAIAKWMEVWLDERV